VFVNVLSVDVVLALRPNRSWEWFGVALDEMSGGLLEISE